jgi:cystathionine beta-lyase
MAHDDDASSLRPATRIVRSGRGRDLTGPFVNPPVVHASTVIFPDAESMRSGRARYTYGRRGTPTLESLEQSIADLEGAAGTVICPSGLNAIATALLAVLNAGDHLLMTDSVYHPGRHICDTILKRLGVETTYYDPTAGGDIAALFRPNTRAVYVELPGSLTFEMQDLPAIAAAARPRDIRVIVDNTWATPWFCKPLALGAHISLMAATKYIVGHSDAMLGLVSADASAWPALKEAHGSMGVVTGPDDIYLGLRGLRTLAVRLERHMASALAVAGWLQQRPEVARVLYPALPEDPGHALWRRDMTGASGLLGVVLKGWDRARVDRFLDALRVFGLGYSWGGFESLAVPGAPHRTVAARNPDEALIRLHVGLEDPADLIDDLQAGFAAAA